MSDLVLGQTVPVLLGESTEAAGLFATQAEAAATAAEGHKETAELASLTLANVYANTTDGLAAVAANETFWVFDDGFLKLYRDVAGVAVLLDSLALSTAVEAQRAFGDDSLRAIETNLNGEDLDPNLGPLYVGHNTATADGLTLDCAAAWPPGFTTRRSNGTLEAPTAVTNGLQLGYWDFRAYFNGQMHNVASDDVVVDGLVGWEALSAPATQRRFYVSDGTGPGLCKLAMSIRANRRVEIGAEVGEDYYTPLGLQPRFYVNSIDNDWGALFIGQPASGAGYAVRFHTLAETDNDYLIGGSSGAGVGTFKFSVRGNGNVYATGALDLGGAAAIGGVLSVNGITNADGNPVAVKISSGSGIVLSTGADASDSNNKRAILGQTGTAGGLLGLWNNAGTSTVYMPGATNSDGYFNTGGKFGIGNAAPDAMLHVTGTAHITGVATLDARLDAATTVRIGGITTTTHTVAVLAGSSNGIVVSNAADSTTTSNRRAFIGQSGTTGGLMLLYDNAGATPIQLTGVANTANYINNGGGLAIGQTTVGSGLKLDVNGLVKIGGSTPASAGATGVAGTVTWDSSYIYVCTATNTWKRVAIATW